MSKSKPARSVRLRSARKARSKKAVGHEPQTKFSSTSHDEGVSWQRAARRPLKRHALRRRTSSLGRPSALTSAIFSSLNSSCLFFCVSCCFIH